MHVGHGKRPALVLDNSEGKRTTPFIVPPSLPWAQGNEAALT
jgi:hypothetical protein